MNSKPNFLGDLEEGIGVLQGVEEYDGMTLARFRGFALLLPPELGQRLSELIGLRVGILRIDGFFRIRVDDGGEQLADLSEVR
jgi:hypothetical protein